MLCTACLLVLSVASTNQLINKVELVAGTRIVNLRTSAAIFVNTKNCGQAMNYTGRGSVQEVLAFVFAPD